VSWLEFSSTRLTKPFALGGFEFFSELGNPGGASKVGPQPYDHPLIAALPPQETVHA